MCDVVDEKWLASIPIRIRMRFSTKTNSAASLFPQFVSMYQVDGEKPHKPDVDNVLVLRLNSD
jgi:hypothetical protein